MITIELKSDSSVNYFFRKMFIISCRKLLLLILIFDFMSKIDCIEEKPFVVLITSYNNARWYEKNLQSVLAQKYTNYRVIYVDDASTDKTDQLVEQFISKHNLKQQITLVRNTINQKKLANLYTTIHQLCKDHEIILELDGDDWLSHPQVLERFNAIYHEKDIWLAYAMYRNVDTCNQVAARPLILTKKTPNSLIQNRKYRTHKWIWSGLRTYYSWLFKKINRNDLIYQTGSNAGSFFKTSSDGATMYPMLEMAGTHVAFVPEILLNRNIETPLNDFKTSNNEQKKIKEILIRKRPYNILRK